MISNALFETINLKATAWMKRVFSQTGEANIDAVTKIIARLYKTHWKRDPIIIHASSPYMAHEHSVMYHDDLGYALTGTPNLNMRLSQEADYHMRSDHASDSLQEYFAVRNHLRRRMGPQLERTFTTPHRLWNECLPFLTYQVDAAFLAHFDIILGQSPMFPDVDIASYFHYAEMVRGLFENCGAVHPFLNGVIVVDWPAEIYHDDNFWLHRTDGPAIRYADGFSGYALHGIGVAKEIIEDIESVTAQMLLNIDNIEARRVVMAHIGIERLLKRFGGCIEDRDYWGGQQYRLISIPFEDDESVLVVECICPSTGRKYLLRVPPKTESCKEAVAWTFGLPVHQYNIAMES